MGTGRPPILRIIIAAAIRASPIARPMRMRGGPREHGHDVNGVCTAEAHHEHDDLDEAQAEYQAVRALDVGGDLVGGPGIVLLVGSHIYLCLLGFR